MVSYLLIELFYIGMPVVRTCGHVITKISRVDGSLRFGAPLARASCARGVPLLKEIVGASAMTPLLTTLTSQKSLSSVPASASLPFVVLSILQSTACKGTTGCLACKLPWCLVTCTVYHSAAGMMFSSTFRRCTFMVFNVLEIEPETWRIVRVIDRRLFFVVLSPHSVVLNARRLSSFRVRCQISNDVVTDNNRSDLTDQKISKHVFSEFWLFVMQRRLCNRAYLKESFFRAFCDSNNWNRCEINLENN